MRVAFGLCLFVCTLAGNAFAQTSSGGSIRGYVKDEQDAVLPGTRVSAVSADAPGVHETVADNAGYYRLTDLPPGEYALTATLDGFAKWERRDIVVRTASNVTLPIVMRIGSVSESVDVTRDTPLLETTRATQSTNIPGEYQRQVPLTSRRHWTSFLALAPGVVATSMPGEANFYYLHGSTFDSHVSLIDGSDVNPAAQNVPFAVNLSNEALEDVQIQTSGIGAATPLGTGLVINATTKSGTNTLRGTTSLIFEPMTWNDSNNSGGTSGKASIFEADLALGGPIVRDALWLFGTYRYNRIEDSVSRTKAQIDTLRALSPGFSPFNRGNRSSFLFLKPHMKAGERQQIAGSYRYDVNPLDGGSTTDAAIFGRTRSGGHGLWTRVSSIWSDRMATTINLSYNTTSVPGELFRTDLPSRPVHRDAFLSAGRLRGSGIIATLDNNTGYQQQPHHKATVSADGTASLGARRRHDVQGGVYLQAVHVENATHYTNGGFALEEVVLRNPDVMSQGTVPFHRQVFDQETVTTRNIQAWNWGVYGQDTWRAADRLTIELGLRADGIRQRDRLFDLMLQRSVDLSPRTGLNYVLTADGSHAVRAGWSRRLDVMTYVSAGSSAAGFRDLYDLNADGVFETVFVTPASTVLLTDRQFDPDRHQPFVDEAFASYSLQLAGNLVVDAGVIHRDFRDAIAMVETNGIYDGGRFSGYRQPSLNDIYLVTNNSWNHAAYKAIQVQVAKRTTTVQAIGGYTRQWRHLDGSWQPNDPASIIQPDAFADDRGIGAPRGVASATEANSLSGTSMWQGSGASQWQDHVVNASLSLRGPFGLLAALSYFFSSGPWSGPVVTRVAAADPRYGPATLVLLNGRLVSNPLATTIRFAGATRGDQQFTLDSLHLLNVSVGRTTHVAGANLDLSLRILNVLNRDSDQLLLSGGNQRFSSNFGLAGQRQPPRAAQMQMRMRF